MRFPRPRGRQAMPGFPLAFAIAAAVLSAVETGIAWAPAALAAVPGPPMRPIPAGAQESLRKSVLAAIGLVPAPAAPYALIAEESKVSVGAAAPWLEASKSFSRPAIAAAERYYDVPADAAGPTPSQRELLSPIEVTVELNGELTIADLASEGGPATLFSLRDATAVRVLAIVPGTVQGRVAAMTPEQAEYRLTALTVFIGDRASESRVREAVAKRSTPRPTALAASNASEVRLIAVRLHGPKKPVEEIANRLPVASLRKLLHK